ncbi:NB-ARC domain-containing protein [Cryptosporangium sp. NPDC051539]|uniref:NB-ARC domain-containing protein n=1 Tax=Cryptosporangium sp. NPDC051539 TaxID=3363962 RepID=UPI00378D1B64
MTVALLVGWFVIPEARSVLAAALTISAAVQGVADVALHRSGTRRLPSLRETEARYPSIGRDVSLAMVSRLLRRHRAFVGRETELDDLVQRYEELRQPGGFTGALVLTIHGPAGIGKTMVANELARKLWERSGGRYQGPLAANLNNGGSARSEAETLRGFLTDLGYPGPMPDSAAERVELFRTLSASRRLLIVLDAAHNSDQVRRLLPTSEDCTVIVTSRTNLGPALGVQSFHLGLPSQDDALAILRSVSQTSEGVDEEHAMSIVEACGRLPIAIKAVGDRILQQDETVVDLARRLEKPIERPEILELHTVRGRGVGERIGTQFERLTPIEQQALGLLTLVPSSTFLPWALLPLYDDGKKWPVPDGPEEARKRLDPRNDLGAKSYLDLENIVVGLADAQLLDVIGRDPVTDLERFGFHPLVRAVVHGRFAESPRNTVAARQIAVHQLGKAYLEAVDQILVALDPTYEARKVPLPVEWIPQPSALPESLARIPEGWIRSDYRNLLLAFAAAWETDRWEICWRLAARLGECTPSDVSADEVALMFDRAHVAATRIASAEHDQVGSGGLELDSRVSSHTRTSEAALLLAEGSYLVGRGDHAGAERKLLAAAASANQRRSMRPAATAEDGAEALPYQMEALAHLRLAQSYLRHGAYADASAELEHAGEGAGYVSDRRLMALVATVRAVVNLHRFPDRPAGPPELPPDTWYGDELWFWSELLEAAGEQPDAANSRLEKLAGEMAGDAGRLLLLHRQRAALWLSAARDSRNPRAAFAALRASIAAAQLCEATSDHAGAIRDRVVNLEALLLLDEIEEAKAEEGRVAALVEQAATNRLYRWSPEYAAARFGHALLAQSSGGDASRAFTDAWKIYRSHGDLVRAHVSWHASGLTEMPETGEGDAAERRIRIWTEDVAPVFRSGQETTILFQIGEAEWGEKFHGGTAYLTVVVSVDNGTVTPVAQRVRLDARAPSDRLRFAVTPAFAGSVTLRFAIHAEWNSALLQEHTVEGTVVVGQREAMR